MKYVKKLDLLNEMAKNWPVGTVVKCDTIEDLSSTLNGTEKWVSWKPDVADKIEGGGFYMYIKESGRSWLVGSILYGNGFKDPVESSKKYRFRTKYAENPGSEFEIFKKYDEEIKKNMNKVFFISDDDTGIMGNDAEKTSITEGEYVVRSLNFKLTKLYNEPVFVLFSKAGSKNFSIKMSDLTDVSAEFSTEQREVIAEWFNKQMGIDLKSSGVSFSLQCYFLNAMTDSIFPSKFNAGPFINKEQADKFLKEMKNEKFTLFNPSGLKVSANTIGYQATIINMQIEELIEFAKASGVNVTVKQLLNLKRGAVTGKKFGI